MALYTQLPIYRTAYDLLGIAVDFTSNLPRSVKPLIGHRIANLCAEIVARNALRRTARCSDEELLTTANSYFGLLRQASHSHADRVRLGRVALRRGRCVDRKLTKTYRRATRGKTPWA